MTDQSAPRKLLNCPFCGGPGLYIRGVVSNRFYVGCELPCGVLFETVDEWNKRSTESVPDARPDWQWVPKEPTEAMGVAGNKAQSQGASATMIYRRMLVAIESDDSAMCSVGAANITGVATGSRNAPASESGLSSDPSPQTPAPRATDEAVADDDLTMRQYHARKAARTMAAQPAADAVLSALDAAWNEQDPSYPRIYKAIADALAASPAAPVAQPDALTWIESEESTRGLNPADFINGMCHTVLWHRKRPMTSNPVWEVRAAIAAQADRSAT